MAWVRPPENTSNYLYFHSLRLQFIISKYSLSCKENNKHTRFLRNLGYVSDFLCTSDI